MTDAQIEAWQTSVENRINGLPHAPSYVLKGRNGSTHVDLIQAGMLVECQDLVNPETVWFVRILKNVGGRLLLRFEGDRRGEENDEVNNDIQTLPLK